MADEFKIVASLNIPESASRINKDIPKLEGQAKHLKIVADLNPTLSIKNIQATLNKMNNNANIKIGIDTSGFNSVQGATQNITNGLKNVQTQAQQTAKSIEKTLTTISADNISDKMVKEFQNSFGIIGKKASETKAIFKDLFATLNNAWYAGDLVKYNSTLTKIYDTTIDNVNASKQLSKEAKNIVDFYKNQLTDGSKVFIDLNVRTELEYILGTSEKIKSVLSTVFGVGKWSYQSGISVDSLSNLIHYDDEIRSSADSIVDAYNKIQQAKSQNSNLLYDTKYGTDAIKQQAQSLLNLKDVYVDLNGVEHNFVEGLGWFESIGEETKDIETETNAIREQTKATQELKAIRDSVIRDANGNQIGRTTVAGNTGFTITSRYNEKNELTSYTETENYKKLEQESVKIEEIRAKYNRLLADFKSSNSAIQSGLTQPIEQFENVLNRLGKTSSINDVKNAFESLKKSASEILEYLNTTNSAFNKGTNAVNHYKDMDNILKEITASFDKLSTKPSNLKSEIDGAKKKLLELQNIEKQEGTNVNWAKKYREVNLELVQLRTNIKLAERASKDDDKANNDLRIEFVQKLNNAYKQLISYKNKLASTTNTDSQKAYADEISKTEKIIDNLIQQLRSGKLITAEIQSQIDLMNEQVALTDRINRNKISNARGKQAVQTFEQQAKQLKDYTSQIDNAIKRLNALQNSPTFRNNTSNPQVIAEKNNISALIAEYQNLKTQLNGNITSAGLDNVGNKLTQLNTQFNDATTTAKRFETELRNDNGAEKQAQRVALLKAQLTALEKTNPKAMKQYGDAIKSLMATLNNNPDTRAIEQVTKNIQLLRREINNANLAGKTLWQTLTEKAGKFIGWMSLTGIISSIWREMKQMVTKVIELDSAMTNLKKVTDETDATYSRFLKNTSQQAKELHSTVTDLIEQTSQWAKLGYNLEQANKLAEASMIYANVGEVDNEQAVTNIVSAVKAFDIAVDDIMSIPDVYNKLGNEFAVSSKNLGVGMSQAATTMALAGNDFNQVAALLTGAGEILGDNRLDEIGTGLKTVTLRIQNQAGALKELGEEYEDLVSVSKTQQQIYELTGGKVNIMSATDPNEFRDTYNILKDVANVINDLNGTDASELVQLLFGKNRANVGTAILKAFQSGQIEKAYEAAKNSAGSAQEEFDRWSQSIEAHINTFKASFESLSQTILDSDLIKFVVDFGTTTLNTLDNIISKFGTIPTLLGSIATVGAVKNVGGLINTPPYAPLQLCA